MSGVRSFVDHWIDGGISVHGNTAGFLMGWDYFGFVIPLFAPALISLLAQERGTPVTLWLFAGGVAAAIPWTAYILKRRKLKIQNWVEPTSFSDETNGY